MIKDLLKNICIISFALIGPITLPAGGIQKQLNECGTLNNSKEIILISKCALYAFPKNHAKQLTVMPSGFPLLVLRQWQANNKEIWLKVEMVSNKLLENPNNTSRGWIKI